MIRPPFPLRWMHVVLLPRLTSHLPPACIACNPLSILDRSGNRGRLAARPMGSVKGAAVVPSAPVPRRVRARADELSTWRFCGASVGDHGWTLRHQCHPTRQHFRPHVDLAVASQPRHWCGCAWQHSVPPGYVNTGWGPHFFWYQHVWRPTNPITFGRATYPIRISFRVASN
jgi:hypothetical protein